MTDELDPAEFVRRIQQLGEQKDQEDRERVRKLEQDILEGRSERQKRREERARSLSPDKPLTPQHHTPRSSVHLSEKAAPLREDPPPDTPKMDPPSRTSAHEESLLALTGGGSTETAQTLEDVEPRKPATSAAALGRSGTLSWKQRRPQSGVGTVRRPLSTGRPLSGAASPAPRETPTIASPSDAQETQPPASPAAPTLSRTQIAESLGSKDPSWFKQTADRGVGSAAHRKSQEEGASEASSAVPTRRPLPGMPRDSPSEPEVSSPPLESSRSVSPSRGSSVRNSVALSNRFSANTSLSGGETDVPAKPLRSPFQLSESQKLAPPTEPSLDGGDVPASPRGLAMSPTQGRLSPERTDRPLSPTKGMGGFVQSAMLKRNDSVSKRWSAHSPQAAVARTNSTVSNRASVHLAGLGILGKSDRPMSLSRDNSVEPYSRPGSSASNATIAKGVPQVEPPADAEAPRPALSRHSRSKSVASTFSEDVRLGDELSPASPSKRWSPTKSTWLENALNKPESPKLPAASPVIQQPSWMAEISRKKQERGSVDLSKGSPLQSPFVEPTGRVSPTKDLPLRPVKEHSAGFTPLSLQPKASSAAQPAWLAEFNRKRQGRGSVDLGKSSPLQKPFEPSGKISPLKDIHLKPALKPKVDEPQKEEKVEPVKQTEDKSTTSRPPTATAKEDVKEAEEPTAPVSTADEQTDRAEDTTEPASTTDEDTKAAVEPEVAGQATEEPKTEPEPAKETLVEPTPETMSSPALESTTQSTPGKTKPKTPPKKDFRAGLRPRQPTITSDPSKKNEISEFQNVFGRLKKTETKKYVAPDTFKDNIVRGKRGLSITGGPKPSVRRDEFKDSLVTQKAAMLAKAQEEGSASLKKPESPAQPQTTPEALTRRRALTRSDSISKVPPPKEAEPAPVPEALARRKSLRAKAPPNLEQKPQSSPTAFPLKDSIKSSKLADRFNPALAGLLARGPPSAATSPPDVDSTSSASAPQTTSVEKTGPAPELTHMTKGRARGPKRRAPAAKKSTEEKEVEVAPVTQPLKIALPPRAATVPQPEHEPEETPKEETPRSSLGSKPATPIKSPGLSQKLEKQGSPDLPRKSPALDMRRKVSGPSIPPRKPSQSFSPEVPKKDPSLELTRTTSASSVGTPTKLSRTASSDSSKPSSLRKPSQTFSPEVPMKKPDLARTPSAGSIATLSKLSRTESNESAKSFTSTKPPSWRSSRPLPTPPSKPETPKEITSPLQWIPTPKEADTPGRFSVKSATSLWSRPSASSSPAGTPKPMTLPTKADKQKAARDAGLVQDEALSSPPLKPEGPRQKPTGLGLGSIGSLGSFAGLVSARSRESSPPKVLRDKALPVSPPASARPRSETFDGGLRSASPEEILAQFFDEPPVTDGELPEHIDTMHILKTPPLDLGPGAKIRSLRKEIQEITGDGKLISIPAQEEHVLFMDSMYLCTHVFGDSRGARHTEVYLWAGNGVADATLEDAQVFARNVARQNQGKLLVLRQGKETPNFFEALGGIVITKRGFRPGSDEYMLCGRRHLGHIAFDEVDFELKTLCSGFAYIVSTNSGKVFIWKGRGCSAEELSGARLIGMDIAFNGDLVEVDEGSEPREMLDLFPPPTTPAAVSGKAPPLIPSSASHWRYKATSDRYRTRLFKVEQQQEASSWGHSLQTLGNGSSTPRSSHSPLPGTGHGAPSSKIHVVEIMPFSQRDLEPEHIYVLDAFFEMYIIVGALARSEAASFATALLFAQDYSILAVSEEDRPLRPITTIVLEGVPRDMKSVFRFWDDALIPAAGLMRGKLGRGKSLRVMKLERAIEATRR